MTTIRIEGEGKQTVDGTLILPRMASMAAIFSNAAIAP